MTLTLKSCCVHLNSRDTLLDSNCRRCGASVLLFELRDSALQLLILACDVVMQFLPMGDLPLELVEEGHIGAQRTVVRCTAATVPCCHAATHHTAAA